VERHATPSSRRGSASAKSPGGLSKFALAGLILAAVPCCPLTALIGAALGLFALRQIRLSGGTLGGRRVALAAVFVGTASALLWSTVFDRFARSQSEGEQRALTDQVERFMDAASSGRTQAALGEWLREDPARPSPEHVRAFGRQVAERFGTYERLAIHARDRSGALVAPVVEVSGTFYFENGAMFGSVRFQGRVEPLRLMPSFRMIRIVIEDKRHGNLALGDVGLRNAEPPGAG